jgi:hypothetical protein
VSRVLANGNVAQQERHREETTHDVAHANYM